VGIGFHTLQPNSCTHCLEAKFSENKNIFRPLEESLSVSVSGGVHEKPFKIGFKAENKRDDVSMLYETHMFCGA